MKKITIKSLYFIFMAVLFATVSCQDNVIEITETPSDEVLAKSSVVAGLMQKTATKDGSKDNIIDKASCISIELPITVNVNGIDILIDSESDYEVIEGILDEFDDDLDEIVIDFPIKITLNDYSVVEINSYDDLENYIQGCNGDNEFDDDIECVDFQYPISFSIYDTNNQLLNTITIVDDENMYHFLEELEEEDIVNINFPVVLLLADGTEKEVSTLEELELAIEIAKDDCDEDDDNDYDDDDCENCNIEETKALLLECSWLVDKVINNNQDNTEQYTDYYLTFFEDGTVKALNNGNDLMGTWELTTEGERVIVTINFNDLQDFSFSWELYEIEDDNEIDLRLEENRLELVKYCIDDLLQLKDYFAEGKWLVAFYLTLEDIVLTANYTDFEFTFNENGTVIATNGNDVVEGTWVPVIDSGELKLTLNFDVVPFDEFNEDWLVVEFTNTRIELIKEENDIVDKLVFEKIN